MTEGKHTPGPWHVDQRFSLRVAASGNCTIANTGADSGLRDDWEANARLIAAAPDMLAACKAITENFPKFNRDAWPDIAKLLDQVRAAIRKATEGS